MAWRVAIAMAIAILALPAPPAAAVPPQGPCPTATIKPSPKRPAPPPAPSHDPAWRSIGGKALAADGLVLPRGAPPVPEGLTARSWLVADLDSGAVLGGCGPHVYGAPASTQKLLLAATLLPRLDPAQKVRVTRADLRYEPGSSAVGLVPRGRYSVRTLWLGLLLNSGNDAANVLARLGGGDQGVAGTIHAMNAYADRLGAYQTHAATPSGLDGARQLTSAYDLALIARACFAREDFRRYTATERARIPAQPPGHKGFQIQNDNYLLTNYNGAIGGKSGFTDLARHTYVGAAERDGRRLVVTLLGAERQPLPAWQQGAKLLDWGFAQPRDASVGRLVKPGEAQRVASPQSHGGASHQAAPGAGVGGLSWWMLAAGLLWALLVAAIGLMTLSRWRRGRRT